MEKYKARKGEGELQARMGSCNLRMAVRDNLTKGVTYQRRSHLRKELNGQGDKL